MEKSIIKDSILIAVGGLILFILIYGLYFGLFMLFERFANSDKTYSFVSSLRVGYGISWLILCLFIYVTHVSDKFKATCLTSSFGTFMISIGVQFYNKPFLSITINVIVGVIILFLLKYTKKNWYHYFGLLISLLALFLYL